MAAAFGLFACTPQLHAAEAGKLVADGNTRYDAGEFDMALSAYDAALDAEPDRSEILFNRGAALYQQGRFEDAAEAFRDATAAGNRPDFIARSHYNLGNCEFKQIESAAGDIAAAIESCKNSIGQYRQALNADGELTAAAENMELAKLNLQVMLQQQQQQQKQDQQKQDAREKLEEMIEKQESLQEQTEKTEQDQQPPESRNEAFDEQSNQQRELEQESKELAEKMSQMSEPSESSPVEEARQHVEEAAKAQKAAAEELEKKQGREAAEKQKEAADELREALAGLEEKEKEQQDGNSDQEQASNQPPEGEENQDPQQQQDQPSQEQPPNGEESGQQHEMDLAQLEDEAKDILEEERENRELRKVFFKSDGRTVEKDW